jgi:hypothetical protein
MARCRLFPCNYWDDPDIETMTASERLLYACLWTNQLTTESGIYKITVKRMSDFTGLSVVVCRKTLTSLEKKHGKVVYDTKQQTVFIRSFTKRNFRYSNRKNNRKAIYNDWHDNQTTFLWRLWQEQYPTLTEQILAEYSDFLMGLSCLTNDIPTPSPEPEIEQKEKSGKFKKPTVEEIRAYCVERKNGVDAQKFYDFYEAKGWMIGKNNMKDWRAAIRTWEQRSPDAAPKKHGKPREIRLIYHARQTKKSNLSVDESKQKIDEIIKRSKG